MDKSKYKFFSRYDSNKVVFEGDSLEGAYLERANLEGANLYDANLKGANLKGANLYGANLERAYLYGANLYGANLEGANLYGAYLEGANLEGANLYDANLERANLEGANLYRAYLYAANLEGANLKGANLYDATLEGAEGLDFQPAQTIVPSEGDIVVYKKLLEGVAKLLVPKEAKRLSATTRKCRAEYAVVLELPDGTTLGHSAHNNSFTYEVGMTVKPTEPFDEDWKNECSSGIHFFITRKEAEEYN